MSKISIVIPVFNAERFIADMLGSVKNQTYQDFECVIVNDGSTDNSLEIINSFVKNDSRFKVFTIPNTGCANIPRDIATQNSEGKFIFNLDADDVIENDCLEKMVIKQSETNSDIVLLTLIGCINDLDGELYRLPFESFDRSQILTGKEAVSMTIGGWQISCGGMLFKKEMYSNIPIGNYMNSDELSSRYILYNAQKVSFSEAKYFYRNHNKSISRNFSPRIFERMLVDRQLEEFVNIQYGINSNEAYRIRNTRLLNMIYLQYDFLKYKNHFSKAKQDEIANYFKTVFSSQNLEQLKKELPFHLKLFLKRFTLFRIYAFLYVYFKRLKGKNYIYK